MKVDRDIEHAVDFIKGYEVDKRALSSSKNFY